MNEDRAIFSDINAHMVSGVMLHDQLYQMFLFLRLYKFAKEQKKRYDEETKSRRALNKYYICHRGCMLSDSKVNASSVIPIEWYQKSRYDMQPEDIRKAVNFALSTWCNWEKETKDFYSVSYHKLFDNGFMAEANYVSKLLDDVDNELAEAEDLLLYFEAMNFDPIEIMEYNK